MTRPRPAPSGVFLYPDEYLDLREAHWAALEVAGLIRYHAPAARGTPAHVSVDPDCVAVLEHIQQKRGW